MRLPGSEESKRYGIKGGATRKHKQKVRIEGEYVTLVEIAERMGYSIQTATKRWAEACKAEGPVTWASFARRATENCE